MDYENGKLMQSEKCYKLSAMHMYLVRDIFFVVVTPKVLHMHWTGKLFVPPSTISQTQKKLALRLFDNSTSVDLASHPAAVSREWSAG